jgi:cyclopropane fatty-acyl-phospholipid synthase-like methyltransferase
MERNWMPKVGSILDVGCGEGTLTIPWAMKTECQVVGIDVSAVAIDLASKMTEPLQPEIRNRLAFKQVDILRPRAFLKEHQGQFDVAVDVGCFHNFAEMGKEKEVLMTIHQLLRRDGKWLLSMRAFRDSKVAIEAEQASMTRHMEQLISDHFTLERVESCDLTGPHAEKAMPGLTFYLRKKG